MLAFFEDFFFIIFVPSPIGMGGDLDFAVVEIQS